MKLFTLTDRRLLEQDAKFWLTSLDTYLQLYLRSKVESDDDKENKALVCARLAGLGLALAEHFGRGVQSLSDVDHPRMMKSGSETFQRFTGHTARLEAATNKELS